MNVEQARNYCLSKKGTTEAMPFGEGVLVFKVMNKMYALLALDAVPATMNLKCVPDWALELRDEYEGIKAGYHMNKTHWNTVTIEESDVSDEMILKLIDHSYDSIVAKLKKVDKEALKKLKEEN
ncbi:MAG: MmcQ/YjbR family DNA-binding protein [Chitinophagales bacterium]